MSVEETVLLAAPAADAARGADDACRVCGRKSANAKISVASLPDELQKLIASNTSPNAVIAEVCSRCVELFERARTQLKQHAVVFERGGLILPTPLRMGADERFTGKAITIAFLDSGFYAHPDLTQPVNRILAYRSIVPNDVTTLEQATAASWHGMMTSVVAAGNGNLSNGFYRSIASDANLVLVKLSDSGRIPESSITQGLEWVINHKDDYAIRIVNISAGGDHERPYHKSKLARTVERAVREGLIIVCAVGNAGHTLGHPVLPPASAPSCIAVGGLDDQNSLDRAKRGMYRSSYGPTVDGLQKPEVIAPGIWVPAPILPNTPTAEQAELYITLDDAPNELLGNIIEQHWSVDEDLYNARHLPVSLLRQLITIKLREGSVITEHYKYVDGTSFAAPVVSSIIACMLEANPHLAPHQVKRILIDTAERVPNIEVDRQGWGVVNARRAVELAIKIRPSFGSLSGGQNG